MGHKRLPPGSVELHFRVPQEQAERLAADAKEAGRSQAQYLRELLAAHLDPDAVIDEALKDSTEDAKVLRELNRRLDTAPASIKDTLLGKLAERALNRQDAERPGDDLAQLLAAVGEDATGRKVKGLADILRTNMLPAERRLEAADDGLVAYESMRVRNAREAEELQQFRDELRDELREGVPA